MVGKISMISYWLLIFQRKARISDAGRNSVTRKFWTRGSWNTSRWRLYDDHHCEADQEKCLRKTERHKVDADFAGEWENPSEHHWRRIQYWHSLIVTSDENFFNLHGASKHWVLHFEHLELGFPSCYRQAVSRKCFFVISYLKTISEITQTWLKSAWSCFALRL